MTIRYVAALAALVAAAAWNLSGQGLPISSDRLLKAADEPGNWLMSRSTYDGWGYSPLDQITTRERRHGRTRVDARLRQKPQLGCHADNSRQSRI